MLFILTTILFIVFLVPLIVMRMKSGDNFHPIVIISFLNIITIIPYLYLISFNPSMVSDKVISHKSFTNLETTIFKFVILQIVAYISMLIGMNTKKRLFGNNQIIRDNSLLSEKRTVIIAIVATLISLTVYFYFINKIGGLTFLFNNLHLRTSIIAGNGYLLTLLDLMMLSTLVLIYQFWNKSNLFYKILMLFLVLINILMLSSFGGRKSTIFTIIFIIIILHYAVKKVKLLRPRIFLVTLFLGAYFLFMPLLRVDGGMSNVINNPKIISNTISEDYTLLIKQLSYVEHYLLIINYFNHTNYWYGQSYLDLLYAPMPSSIYLEKPPVDEGMYIRTLAENISVYPNSSRNELYNSSWPPETFGVMYMNFGIIGLFFGFWLLGFLLKQSYLYMISTNFSFVSIYIYSYIVLNFELSNLRLVQTATSILLVLLFYSLLTGKVPKKQLN